MTRTALLTLLAAAVMAGCYDVQFGGNTDEVNLVPGDDDDDAFGGDDDDASDDDDATDDDDLSDDDDTTPPPPETDCSDGLDNDGDGLRDCEDPDCDLIAPCDQPTAIFHTGNVVFNGSEIECYVAGWPFDVDVDDCQTTYSSSMGAPTTVPACAVCDATFEGPNSYSVDSCASLIGQASPTSGAFGLIFTSTSQWEFYARNEDTGQWESGGFAVNDGSGTYTFTASDTVSGSPPDCDWPTDQTLGTITLTLTFAAN